ncbi:MAG TPA: hypothetical protein PKA88_18020 [Polyangiaceae bacterium]|nr:hypothetical protein [Polyangiaceae bacterium]HMR81114.1 hypothetical protein [Polyangiaceae bacterium]
MSTTDETSAADGGSEFSEGLGAGADARISALWEKHAQFLTYQVPGGFGGHIALRVPAGLMAELAFKHACKELLETAGSPHKQPMNDDEH